MTTANTRDSLPAINRHSSLRDCVVALLTTRPTDEETAYARAVAKSGGGPVSQYAVARSVEMKRRKDAADRITRSRRVLMPRRIADAVV